MVHPRTGKLRLFTFVHLMAMLSLALMPAALCPLLNALGLELSADDVGEEGMAILADPHCLLPLRALDQQHCS